MKVNSHWLLGVGGTLLGGVGVVVLCALAAPSQETSVSSSSQAHPNTEASNNSEKAFPASNAKTPAAKAGKAVSDPAFVFEDVSDLRRIPYQVEVQGAVPSSVLKEFHLQGQLLQNKERTLVCLEQAWQIASNDATVLEELCHKKGHFDAKVTWDVKVASQAIKAKEATLANQQQSLFAITFFVTMGPRYRVIEKRFEGKLNDLPRLKKFHKKVNLLPKIKEGEPLDFSQLVAERYLLKTELMNAGAYLAQTHEPLVDIDRDRKQAIVTFAYEGTRKARVSTIVIQGEGHVPKRFIRQRLAFREGSLLTQKAVEHSKEDLLNSGLLSRVQITVEPINKKSLPGENEIPIKEGALPSLSPLYGKANEVSPEEEEQPVQVLVEVSPAAPRTIGLGAYLSASEGPMASALWQNKNFLSKAFDLGAMARVGKKELSAMTFLNIPDALGRQEFHADLTLKHYNTTAFEGEKISATVGFTYKARLGDYPLSLSFLPTVEHAKLTRRETHQRTLGGLILGAKFDFANHPLYPTSGMTIQLGCEPYFGKFSKIILKDKKTSDTQKTPAVKETNKKVHSMTILTGKISGYLPLGHQEAPDMNATVLAGFVSLGKILIKDLDYVPFDKRFYGGGRNSIRSYGYQLCCRFDEEDKPLGETSILEACIEPRFRLSEDWGMVAFLEMSGSPFGKKRGSSDPGLREQETKEGRRKTLWGIGFGGRYFTRFGPIRFDVGFPLTRRPSRKEPNKKADKAIQFYISIGQSF